MLAKKGFCLIFCNRILEHIFERKPNLLKTTQGLNKKNKYMQNKILSLATLRLSPSIGKEQKPDEIHEQDSLKKSDILLLIFRRNSSKQIYSAAKEVPKYVWLKL